MTRSEALMRLRDTRELSTGMLRPLGISFEAFLRYGQVSAETREKAVDALLAAMGGGE